MPRLKGKPSLTKAEVDEYINKWYRSIIKIYRPKCVKMNLDPFEVLSLWYSYLLRTESTKPKKIILSRRSAMFFLRHTFQEVLGKRGRKKYNKLNVYKSGDVDKLLNNLPDSQPSVLDRITEQDDILDLEKKVYSLQNNIYDYRNYKILGKKPALQLRNIYHKIVKGEKVHQESRRNLIRRLREAYGIEHNSTINNSGKIASSISSG